MKLYSSDENYKLYNGNMLDMMEVIEPNTIDAIVTDPPYELNFMNKGWDNSGIAFQKDTWKKCYEVLKPGGHLLAFGGSRTFHRIACAIEDAGFEIRDTIMWLYGCLSEDTEILTSNGFKHFHKITNDDIIRIYDIKNGIYKWEKPERWNVYSVNKDTCYRIKSDSTDQLVSKNHRCLIEREGKLVFEFAENLNGMERVPVLSYNIPYIQESERNILFTDLLWQDERLVKGIFSEWKGKRKSEEISLWSNKPIMERWSDLSQEKRELCKSKYQICEMSERIYNNGEKRWLCNGASPISGTSDSSTIVEDRSCSPYQSQCRGQQIGEFDVVCDKSRPQELREWKTYQTTMATITKEEYSGIIYCPTVSTGCFVARRNGKVFITGNSGFPKSMDISKQIDKRNGRNVNQEFIDFIINHRKLKKLSAKDVAELGGWYGNVNHGGTVSNWENGSNIPTKEQYTKLKEILDLDNSFDEYINIESAEREVIGTKTTNKTVYQKIGDTNESGKIDITIASTDLAKRWDGWGTQLKPSYEPIIIARKPCEESIVDNVMKYGVGGINIDECRVGNEIISIHNAPKGTFAGGEYGRGSDTESYRESTGRFPANTILTYDETDFDEVCGAFPNTKSGKNGIRQSDGFNKNDYGKGIGIKAGMNNGEYGDSGSASRYFYCAKASKRDRDEGLNEFNDYILPKNGSEKRFTVGGSKDISLPRKNIHPTVKPTSLMQYLVRLVTPKSGTVLDPFNGSGSTGKACMYENADRNANYKYVGIELTEEYLPIAKARIEFAEKNPIMDYEDKMSFKNNKVKDETKNVKNSRSTIFDL